MPSPSDDEFGMMGVAELSALLLPVSTVQARKSTVQRSVAWSLKEHYL